MSIIMDLIIVGIFAVSIFFGYQKGLTKCVIKIFSFVIALILAAILFKPVSNLVMKNTQIEDKIKEAVINLVGDDIAIHGKIEEDTNLPKAMVNYINKAVEEAETEARENIVPVVAENIATTTINVGVAIGLFLVIRIGLIFVSALSSLFTDLPIVKQFDKTGGIIYGLLKAFVIVSVLLAILSFISPMIEQTGIIVAIHKSFIGSLLYDHNILLNIAL